MEILPEYEPDNMPPVTLTHPLTNPPTDCIDTSLEIAQFSVGPVTAQQLDLMESDATITPDGLSQQSNEELSTTSEDNEENIIDSTDLFDPSTENISPTPMRNPSLPNGHNLTMNIDSSVPTRIATQPALVTGKGCEPMNLTKTFLQLNITALEIQQTNVRNTVPRTLNCSCMFYLL